MSGVRQAFVESLGFAPDDFQVDALDALDSGVNVLVSAPTGSGKTVVANYAVRLALESGGRAFYTTPLKALSNQKFARAEPLARTEPRRPAHRGRVGQPRGAGRRHDDRGPAQHDPDRVRSSCATSAPGRPGRGPLPPGPLPRRRLGGGPHPHPAGGALRRAVGHRRQRRDARRVAVHRARPHRRSSSRRSARSRCTTTSRWSGADRPAPRSSTCSTGRASRTRRAGSTSWCARRAGSGPGRAGRAPAPRRPRPAIRPPRRSELLLALQREDLLPAIVFIFRRAACEDAVRQCVRDGLRFTTTEQRREVERIATRRVGAFTDEDLGALEFARLPREPQARPRPAPRRDGPGVPRGRRGLLRAQPARRGVRDRDPGARDQHAGALGGARAVLQVLRRRARDTDQRRVRPDDRARGPSGPRRRGPRRRLLLARHLARRRGSGRDWRRRRTCTRRSGRPTTSPPTWSTTSTWPRRPRSSSAPSPSSRPTAGPRRRAGRWPSRCWRATGCSRSSATPRGGA